MRFYHYTSVEHLKYIKRTGLNRGDVPLNPHTIGTSAVWLTTDNNAKRQKWAKNGIFNKLACRITVDIPLEDSRLVKWYDFAKEKRVPDYWYKALDVAGGGGSEHWYLFFGVIEPKYFKCIKILESDVTYASEHV